MTSARVRPFHIIGAHALQTLELQVLSGLLPWAQDWLPASAPEPSVTLTCESRTALPSGEFTHFSGANGHLWIEQSQATDLMLGAALLGGGVPLAASCLDELLEQLISQARHALHQMLADTLVGASERFEQEKLPPDLAAAGAGTLMMRAPGLGLTVVADGGVWRHVPPVDAPRPPAQELTPLDHTLTRATVDLAVYLGSVELSLGPLLELRVGDVIRLPAQLNEPLAVHAGKHRIASGGLGTHTHQRAIQWMRTDPLRNSP